MIPLKSRDRVAALHSTETNLLWLHLDSNLAKARSILLDAEIQAAVIASAGYGDPVSSSNTSDPTGEAAMLEASTEIRANTITAAWMHDFRESVAIIRWIRRATHDALGLEPPANRPAGLVRALRDLRALTVVPHNLSTRAGEALEGEALLEYDAAVQSAHNLAQRVRFGAPPIGNSPAIPGVSNVLAAAVKVTQAAPPPPKQKPPQGCISCKRDKGHFEPIDVKNHNARSMCRVCGDYFSGEGRMLPIGAVEYMHRTGKRLTWKIIEAAKLNERAS